MLRFAFDGITSFSNFPLKFASFLGFTFSGISFILILFALYEKIILHNTVRGWTSLILVVLFLGGIQLLSIGIIGEYIGRISTNIRNRPLYVVNETNIEELNNKEI
jgi:dolichol-phosphate mannosyltransferase